MILSEKTKQSIQDEFDSFLKTVEANKEGQYGDGSRRDELGQFYTNPTLCAQMIEKFDSVEDDILDPTAGSGNLLAACIMAGADPKRIYANELDAEICEKILRPRLSKLGVPDSNIHVGDALNSDCLKLWSDKYEYKNGAVFIDGKRVSKFGKMYMGLDSKTTKILK